MSTRVFNDFFLSVSGQVPGQYIKFDKHSFLSISYTSEKKITLCADALRSELLDSVLDVGNKVGDVRINAILGAFA